jgi:cytochrome c biogenesis protein CcdA/glutaredoxin
MKKFFISATLFLSLFFIAIPVFASNSFNINAYFFFGNGCPHCENENAFLESIKDNYPSLNIYKYEVFFNKDNSSLMQKVAQTLKAEVGGVPFLIIGDRYFVGYAETLTSVAIENRIKECVISKCPDSVGNILGKENNNLEPAIQEKQNILNTEKIEKTNSEKIIKLPFLGDTNIYSLSLLFLAVLMGLLDGFNPCALWTLIFLISLLLEMNDRKRMWIIGTTFIVASASVYFIFMAAWLNIILFLGFVIWVRILIGLLALFGGGYNIREFFVNKANTCKVENDEQKLKVFERLKEITKHNNLWIMLGGIILLAFLVNLVELVCSAGLPAVFTQVLALSELSNLQYYLYILLYLLFFMIDDLFVFFIAMITLQMTGITSKYSKYSHIFGGILMFILGILLIFKPELLMFG